MRYSGKVLEHFQNTKNYGKIEDADAIGKVGNKKCGDVMWIYLKVDDGIITDAKYETFGCVAAIATSSIAMDMIVGKNLDEAAEISNKAVAEALDGLPPEKMHCELNELNMRLLSEKDNILLATTPTFTCDYSNASVF
ncbi:MAG: iron-sulfur cluster assembly scaffold protein [bacterium]|nr:iron-sulfur cluster assembly scaffold protein [bacterium]